MWIALERQSLRALWAPRLRRKRDPQAHYVQNLISEAFDTVQDSVRAIAKYRKVHGAFNTIQGAFDHQLETDVVNL